jgi:hypothetical protein
MIHNFNTSRFKKHMTCADATVRELPKVSGRMNAPVEKTEKLAPKVRPQPRRSTMDPKWAFNMGE